MPRLNEDAVFISQNEVLRAPRTSYHDPPRGTLLYLGFMHGAPLFFFFFWCCTSLPHLLIGLTLDRSWAVSCLSLMTVDDDWVVIPSLIEEPQVNTPCIQVHVSLRTKQAGGCADCSHRRVLSSAGCRAGERGVWLAVYGYVRSTGNLDDVAVYC